VEAIVAGPNSCAALRKRCCNTGPDGDSNPATVLVDVAGLAYIILANTTPQRGTEWPVERPLPKDLVASGGKNATDLTAILTDDKGGHYISGMKFGMAIAPTKR
jgi:hypothetical protein